MRAGSSPDETLSAADAAGLKTAALTVVAAWYTGTAGSGRDALMQRTVADALLPPTYAFGGPAWWTASPPEVGLSRPVAAAASPPTTGNPEPESR